MGMRNERDHLKRFYGPKWASKVDKMSDSQVLAIFMKFKAEGKIK